MSGDLLQTITDVISPAEAPEASSPPMGDVEESVIRDDQKVIRLLAGSDGYAWQGEIANRLGWTGSKTCRCLQEMEDAGRITRYKIGRRNVVCLPHREPESLQDKAPLGEQR